MYRISLIVVFLLASMRWQAAAQCAQAQKIEGSPFANLYRINDSMYRAEQPTRSGIAHLSQMGVRSLLSVRSRSDSAIVGNSQLEIYHIPMKPDSFSHEDIMQAMSIIQHSPKPILIHCSRGADRTGVVTAAYRMVFCGWTAEQSIDEMRNGGYHFDKSLTNIDRYLRKLDPAKMKEELEQMQR